MTKQNNPSRRAALAGFGGLTSLGLWVGNTVQAQIPARAQARVIDGRWSEARVNAWYDGIDWPVGANYVPRNAINQLEMWQADTFSPDLIDEELGWAAGIGMNTLRVFLHDLAFSQDPEGFLGRVDRFLGICARHNIRPMLVFFDDVWNPEPKSGKQPEPRPHLHNSGWVQSPGKHILGNPALQDALKPYVQTVMRRFAQDERVLAWDLYNEPANLNGNSYGEWGAKTELPDKPRYTLMLLEKAFRWAREVAPSQPVSSGVFWFTGGGNAHPVDPQTLKANGMDGLHPVNRFVLANSDIINWHQYDHAGQFTAEVREFMKWNRPLFLTEYLARDNGAARGTNRFDVLLPVAKAFKVGMFNWGLVDGKSQTKYPWDTWDTKWTRPPRIWHHDIFHADGRPYDPSEVEFIHHITGKG